MSAFKLQIASVPDREKLVAEIWYNDVLFAEISQENKVFNIEFFEISKEAFNLTDLLYILELAKKQL